jgi:hypothetical protein
MDTIFYDVSHFVIQKMPKNHCQFGMNDSKKNKKRRRRRRASKQLF